ncbi:MAG: GNAT family N-acetyltransferase [Ilumatobacteraceae bacterium]
MTTALRTERLVLRRWRDTDREAFHDLNSDPVVMATIGPVMNRAESDAFMNRCEERFDEKGFGLWCVEHDGVSIGFTGFMVPWFRDGVEIGWRIRSAYWGRGFAPEAARACLDVGLRAVADGGLGFDEVISFTARRNTNSRRVMEKIGLEHDPAGDFDHPGVPATSDLRPHVLYRSRTTARFPAEFSAPPGPSAP